ncbi:hypothetical protein LCGC14_2307890 [marine sediment metagenome]|uniref:Uncharacterized protein n=1 Tax=marine sediment metagenome TaxID=412755 RepID=A0A0F9D912_9ZZZZ
MVSLDEQILEICRGDTSTTDIIRSVFWIAREVSDYAGDVGDPPVELAEVKRACAELVFKGKLEYSSPPDNTFVSIPG